MGSMIQKLLEHYEREVWTYCHTIAQSVPSRIIERNDGDPYLGRYYLLRRLRQEEEEQPNIPNVYLHFFFRGDDDIELHNHPWKYSMSFVLTGGYIEEYRTKDNRVVRRVVRPGMFNFIRANDFHRVTLLQPDFGAWTIFFTWKRVQSWGFWHPKTGVFTDWKNFFSAPLNKKNNEVR